MLDLKNYVTHKYMFQGVEIAKAYSKYRPEESESDNETLKDEFYKRLGLEKNQNI